MDHTSYYSYFKASHHGVSFIRIRYCCFWGNPTDNTKYFEINECLLNLCIMWNSTPLRFYWHQSFWLALGDVRWSQGFYMLHVFQVYEYCFWCIAISLSDKKVKLIYAKNNVFRALKVKNVSNFNEAVWYP